MKISKITLGTAQLGIPSKDELPNYRILKVQASGHFSGPFDRNLMNAPIAPLTIPEKFRDWAQVAYLTQPISVYVDSLRNKNTGSVTIQWPVDIVAIVGDRIYQHLNCVQAWQVIPRGAFVALLDNVRNRILYFALEIEKTAPDAGEAVPGSQPISKELVVQVFNNYISGNVGNIASGSQRVTQTAQVYIVQGDLASLEKQLIELGFVTDDVQELKAAIEEDSKNQKGIGKEIGAWLGKALAKAGSGLLKVTVSTASNVLPKLISQYLGIPE